MWFCLNNGFCSAVENRNNKNELVVRARRREHLEDNFIGYKVIEGGSTDYKYRIFIDKEKFSEIIKDKILDIDYDNFKSSVEDDDLHTLYAMFWNLHFRYQR
jgi:hypothetical protein